MSLSHVGRRAPADDLEMETLFSQPLAVMADLSHPLVGVRNLSLADVVDEQWTLSPPDSFLGRLVGGLFTQRRLPLPVSVMTSISIYMRLNLMASGRYLSVLPLSMIDHPANRAWLRALDIDLADTSGPVVAITLKKRQGNRATQLFLKALHEQSGARSKMRSEEAN